MEAFYSFNERFAKIRSKRIKKAIKGITGKSFLDADESEQDNPSTSKTIKKKEASSSSHARGREKRKNDYGVMGSQEDNIIDNTNSLAETVENTRENNNTTKIKRGSSCGRPKGRGRSRTTAGSDATINQEDYEIEYSTSASDEDSCKRHSNSYGSEGRALRRSSRKRKQVTYMEDGHEAYGNDVPMHQNDENNPGQPAAAADVAGEDTGFNIYHQDTSELNSSQMHTGAGITEDINEDSQRFELREDNQVDSTPKDYLFNGGGFCMEGEGEGDEQEPACDQSGAEVEPGPSGPCGAMDEVSESASISTAMECTENARMEARGASSSQQRRKASRGLSAMPTLIKRRRKS